MSFVTNLLSALEHLVHWGKVRGESSCNIEHFYKLFYKLDAISIQYRKQALVDYFPEYQENPDYLPPKKFMWDIFSTKDSNIANKFISHSLKERNLKDFEGERTLEVSEDVLNQLHSAHYFSKKKGKALFMLSASKERGTIKRNRKMQLESLIFMIKKKRKNQAQRDKRKIMKEIKGIQNG